MSVNNNPDFRKRNAAAARIPSLDGLRAISIIAVIIGHLHGGATGIILATIGVHIFFVISGYLITSLLQIEYAKNGRINLTSFYRRRAFRILPAAFTYIFVVALLIPSTRKSLLNALTYTVAYNVDGVAHQFTHLWSLSIEEQFYLFWPIVIVLTFRKRACAIWIVMIAAVLARLFIVFAATRFPATHLHYFPLAAMDSVAAGCLLAIYEPFVARHCGWMADVRAISIALPLTVWVLAFVCLNGLGSVFWGIISLMIALWIFLVVQRRDWILNNRPIAAVGTLSYSLYLWQQLFTVEHTHYVLTAILMTFSFAIASYFVIEKPMLALSAAMSKATQPVSRRLSIIVNDSKS